MHNTQSIIENRVSRIDSFNQSTIDNRVGRLHSYLTETLQDDKYGIGHTYKIARKLSDHDINQIAEYCARKANNPVAAFIAICEKKIAV